MNRMLSFAKRTLKEIARDPLTLFFGLGFPLILLLLLSLIEANIPQSLFEISALVPGVSVFGLSFMTLFSAQLISKDRGSSLLQRLYTTPLKASHFILGYLLPILPICFMQCAICYAVSLLLGFRADWNTLLAILLVALPSLFYIALGLLCGSALSERQVGGICGALLTNVSAWLSGIWFDVRLLGKGFEKVANALPFIHAVELERAAVRGDWTSAGSHVWWVLGYGVATMVLAVLVFLNQMKKE